MNVHNQYDPESLLTGAEAATGMTYTNSQRQWPDDAALTQAVSGNLTCEEILRRAPRVFRTPADPQRTGPSRPTVDSPSAVPLSEGSLEGKQYAR